jgi:hypothetical protein
MASNMPPDCGLEKERWADVPGHQGYQVSETGKLRERTACGWRLYTPLKVKSKGFLAYDLYTTVKKRPMVRRCYVHRLVYEAFKGKIDRRFCVRQRDGDRTNNRLDNLVLLSMSEARPRCAGETHAGSKLTWNQVDEMRSLRSEGWTLQRLAERYEVTAGMVSRIVRGEAWRVERRDLCQRA